MTQAWMGGFGGNFIYKATHFAFPACGKSGCGEIHLNNTQKPIQNSSSSISSTLI